jgi:hypothetical protein
VISGETWPALPYEEWRETRDTLHMYAQVVGKIRLALCPFEPQWGNVPLFVSVRGLATPPIPVGTGAFDAEIDLIDHVLTLRSTDGRVMRSALGAPVADFYDHVLRDLAVLGCEVSLSPVPSEVADPIAFPDDRTHRTYDPAHAYRFWRVLSLVDRVFKEHRRHFNGRTTPVNFFWGTFDLALTRYSGRRADPGPGADLIRRMSANMEQIAAGWWPGDEAHPFAAFYAYAYPKPDGIERARIRPAEAAWDVGAGEFFLPYEAVRTAPDPSATILEFLRDTYEAGARLLHWSSELTSVERPEVEALA